MSEKDYSFDQALSRLKEIAKEIKKKDIDLDKAIELLEEGIILFNICGEKVDQTRFEGDLIEKNTSS